MKATDRNFGLDFIRATAIMLVMLAHLAKQFELFGFWGVELFFALSGYLIGQILWRNFSGNQVWSTAQILNFWQRRWWRTLPAYYLFFLLMIPFHIYFFDYYPQMTEMIDSLWFGQNLLSRNSRFYGVSWSLCIEEWFYLLFPLGLFITGSIWRSKPLAFLITSLIFITGSIVLRFAYDQYSASSTLRTVTFIRLDAICYGVLMAFVNRRDQMTSTTRWTFFWAGLLLVLLPAAIATFTAHTLAQMRQNPLMLTAVPLGSALMIPLLCMIRKPGWRPLSLAIEKLSLWSYSMYLSHIPLIFIAYAAMPGVRDTFWGNMVSKLAGLVLTVAVSALLFKYFELPFMHRRPKQLRENREVALPAAVNTELPS